MKSFRLILGAVGALALSLAFAASAPTAALAKNVASADCTLNAAGDNCQEVQYGATGGLGFPKPVRLVPQVTNVTGASGNVANATAAASIGAVASTMNYVTGFQCTAAGATSAAVVNATLAGVVTGTMTYTFTFPAGATTAATPLVVTFAQPIPASAVNTAITISLPAGGTGNTNASCNIQGFRL